MSGISAICMARKATTIQILIIDGSQAGPGIEVKAKQDQSTENEKKRRRADASLGAASADSQNRYGGRRDAGRMFDRQGSSDCVTACMCARPCTGVKYINMGVRVCAREGEVYGIRVGVVVGKCVLS